MESQPYAVGQVWACRGRQHEEEVRLLIVAVTEVEDGDPVYSVFLHGLELNNPHVEGGVQTSLQHTPVSREALDASVVDLIGVLEGGLPDFEEGYQHWREAFDRGDAGVWTIPVAEIAQVIEDTIPAQIDE